MLRVVIIDDEKTAREVLNGLISQSLKNIKVVGEASSADEGIKLINALKPDLLFLDIRLNQRTGFDVLKEIDTTELSVIFTTAYAEYAIKAIKYAALDYLLKPIDPDELKTAVNKAIHAGNKNLSVRLSILEEAVLSDNKAQDKIVLTDISGFKVVQLADVMRCEGEKNYTTFHLSNGQKITSSKSLIEFEKMLEDSSFVRVYKSHLVNLSHVVQYKKGRGGSIIMSNGDVIPVSREKKEQFISLLTKH